MGQETEVLAIYRALPGTARHQALLRTIIEPYEQDDRVLAIGVLGSLGRGTWDEWSDLDLDIVTTGEIDAVAEGQRLGGPDALVLPTRPGEVDVGVCVACRAEFRHRDSCRGANRRLGC